MSVPDEGYSRKELLTDLDIYFYIVFEVKATK